VDAAGETIEEARGAGADALLTHHGLVWGSIERVTGSHYDRLSTLLDAGMALYVSHLPLDGHQDLGNAAGVADVLDLMNRAPFGSLGTEYVGQRGTAREPFSIDGLADRLESALATGEADIQVLPFGPDEVRDIAVVTGSGVDWLDEAASVDVDALVTGEGKQQAYHEAREAEINVVLAGHYATETFGVRALQSLVEEWGLETTYIEHPTGL
jgi:dinuclear metal center YbgI/SA1388 family protein